VLRKRAWAGAAWLATAVFSVQASAANLVEVRVGSHADFTRVVLETDAPVRYELSRSTPGEVRVRLFAGASPRTLGSKSKLLKEVVVEADSTGSVARLALKQQAAVDVKEMVLDKPPRIVLDLVPRKGGAAPVKAEPEPAPAAEPAPAPDAAESEDAKPAEPVAEEAPPPPPAPEEAKVEPAPAPAPAEEEVAARDYEAEAKAARDASNAAKEAAAQAELDRLAGVPSRSAPGPAAEPAPAAEAAPADPAVAPPSEDAQEKDAAAAVAAEESEGYDAPADEPRSPVTASGARTRAPAPGALAFLPAPLDDPLVMGVVGSLLALVAVLAVLRGRSARAAEQEGLASPFSSADGYALPPSEGASIASLAPEADMGPLFASAAAREHESDDGGMFDVGEDEAMREEAKPEPVPYVAMSSAAAPASAPSYNASDLEGLDMRVIEELERRLAHLETRLEEVVDAKERLERHVAAQTEELRVQRAAIARTQRVLRGVVKSDDLATEPAPKV
jgi:hypothetical protein